MYHRVFCVLAITLFLATPPGRTAQPSGTDEGTIGDAPYLIEVPSGWNGGLVIFAHGYQGERPGPGPAFPEPLGKYLTDHGYAWAASGYRSNGYHPDWFLDDLLALRRHFIERFGAPRWSILHGQSMGGHVAIASLELDPEVYQGALLECGVIDGVGLVDWLRAYTAVAQYVSGLPLLDTPHPEFDLLTLKFRELIGLPGHYTELGKRFDSIVKHLMGGDLPLRVEGMVERYAENLNPKDPGVGRAREFASYADTRQIRYDIDPGYGVDGARINREIPRISPAPDIPPNPVFAELSGKVRVPVLALHETADFRVPFWLQQDYRRRTEQAGTSHLLVQRAIRATGHCGFSDEERVPAFEALVAWIERGAMPEGDDVLGDVTRIGLRWTHVWDPRDPMHP